MLASVNYITQNVLIRCLIDLENTDKLVLFLISSGRVPNALMQEAIMIEVTLGKG